MNDYDIGVITEQGDLGLGYNELSDDDKEIIKSKDEDNK